MIKGKYHNIEMKISVERGMKILFTKRIQRF